MRASGVRRSIGVARLVVSAATLAAIITTFADAASRGPVNPFSFFGYFTIQSNVLTVLVAALAGALAMRAPGPQPRWLVTLRALTTMCMAITGLVYATLLAPLGAAGGVPVPWANWVMHISVPILIVVDWLLVRDRRPLPWRAAWAMLAYPIVWLVVVLVRGATDGWVPYPFLDPSHGYGPVAVACLAIAAAFVGVAALVVWWSRFRHAPSEALAPA